MAAQTDLRTNDNKTTTTATIGIYILTKIHLCIPTASAGAANITAHVERLISISNISGRPVAIKISYAYEAANAVFRPACGCVSAATLSLVSCQTRLVVADDGNGCCVYVCMRTNW